MILRNVRFSYVTVKEPRSFQGGKPKYGCQILIPKPDAELVNQINEGVEKAIQKGIDQGKFNAAAKPLLKRPLRDGDAERAADDSKGKEYENHFFLNANSDDPFKVVGPDSKVMMDINDFYSGCYGHVDVDFFAYNKGGGKGVAVGIQGAMKTTDGDRLDGRRDAEDTFAGMAVPAEEAFADDGELK